MATSKSTQFQFPKSGTHFTVMAGPCSIESTEQFLTTSRRVHAVGASVIRGGIYKMRTNPESFQGLGLKALPIISEMKRELGLPMISEITDPRQIEEFDGFVDIYQVGARNMYNYALLKELGQLKTPILLKRAFSATLQEWLLAAEYIERGGNQQIALCERGIRTFETATRNTLDLSAVAFVRQNSHYPIIVDPSHGVGVPSLIGPMSKAALAAGADGILVEVHVNPAEALSDKHQALSIEQFETMMAELRPLAKFLGRKWGNHESDLPNPKEVTHDRTSTQI